MFSESATDALFQEIRTIVSMKQLLVLTPVSEHCVNLPIEHVQNFLFAHNIALPCGEVFMYTTQFNTAS